MYIQSTAVDIFLGLKNRHITILAIFRDIKTHDTKNVRNFKNFFLIHLTVIKNILKFKINRSTQMFTFRQRTTTTDDDKRE